MATIQATGNGTTNGTGGADTIYGTGGVDNIYGGDGDDVIYGYDGPDNVRGTGGQDVLYGGVGKDFLDGGTGDDIMAGGVDDDTYVVDTAGDQVIENDGEGIDTVKSFITYTLGDTLENLQLQGSADLNGTGNAARNAIQGNAGSNLLAGLGGDDSIRGWDGNDVLAGGEGSDWLKGDGGGDCFRFDTGDTAAIDGTDRIADLNFTENDEICLDGFGPGGTDLELRSYEDIGTFLAENPGASIAKSPVSDDAVLSIPTPGGHIQTIVLTDASGLGSSWAQIQPYLPPVAGGDSASTGENTVAVIDVLANDTGPGPLSIASATAPSGQGTVAIEDGKLKFDPGSDFDHLPAGQTALVTLTYTVATPFGRTATGTVQVTVIGANDAATIGGTATGAVTEDNPATATGQLTVTDIDDGEASFQAGAYAGTWGTLTLAADGKWSYALDPVASQALRGGQIATDAITVKSADGTTKVVTISATGANDAATIGGTATGTVTEDVTLTASGTLTVSDADAGEASFQAGTIAGSYGSLAIDTDGAWTYTLNNAAVQSLGAGDTRTDTIVVKSADGTAKSVVITVKGTNDAAVIGGCDTGSVTEDRDYLAAGKLTISDADSKSWFSAGIYKGAYGYVLLTSDGGWLYVLNPFDSGLDTLNEGQSAVDAVIIKASDGTTHAINVTVNGQNECPTWAKAFTGTGDLNDFDNYKAGAVAFSTLSSSALGNANIAYGTTGNDNLDAKAGNDTVYGWAGHDTLTGGAGNDTLYGGTGNDTLNGGTENDTLFGGSGTDTLCGEAGNDVLVGGFGADRLTGGAGNDVFRFLDTRDTGDTITDFTRGSDKIDLSVFKVGGVDFDFNAPVQDDKFSTGHNLIWFYDGSNTVILGNTDGNPNTAEFVLTLAGRISLSASDFLL